MDIEKNHGGKNMDDKAVEGRWRILRETAAMPQNNPKSEAEDQQCDVYHGIPKCRDRQIGAAQGATMPAPCVFVPQRSCSGRLLGSASFPSHNATWFPRLAHTKWTKDTLGPLNEAIESHRLVFAADNPISAE